SRIILGWGPGRAFRVSSRTRDFQPPLLTENSSHARATAIRFALLLIGLLVGRLPARGESGSNNAVVKEGASSVLEFIETDFENASPVWYEVATDGVFNAYLPSERERVHS